MIIKGEETMQETLSQCMDKLCKTLVYYLREKEVNYLIELLVKNLADPSGRVLQFTSLLALS